MMTQAIIMEAECNRKEGLWNAITHGLGCLLAIPALVLLILKANGTGSTMN